VSPTDLAPAVVPPDAKTHTKERTGQLEEADRLLRVMASIRRSGRLQAGRPVELSSMTGSQLDLVRLVLRRPGVSINQAAEELRLAPNTVSTLVRQLTDGRLMTRRSDPDDRRVARLVLTLSMQRKVAEFLDRRVALLDAALTELSPGMRRRLPELIVVLEQIGEVLQEVSPADG
jgi:DNA-binding MarR family transcriptional regulator